MGRHVSENSPPYHNPPAPHNPLPPLLRGIKGEGGRGLLHFGGWEEKEGREGKEGKPLFPPLLPFLPFPVSTNF